jgi:hypothetical protein
MNDKQHIDFLSTGARRSQEGDAAVACMCGSGNTNALPPPPTGPVLDMMNP